MFSNPNMNMVEWVGGSISFFLSMGLIIGVGILVALIVIKILGSEEIRSEEEQRTLDTKMEQERKRTAA